MKTFPYRVSSLFFVFIALNGCKDKIPNAIPIEFAETSGTNITEFTVTLSSAITKSGSQEISDHGFAISASSETPNIGAGSIKKGAVDMTTPTPIEFSGTLNGLEANTEYFVRPYAVTAQATHFGNVLKVKTLDISQPAIKTDGSEAVTHHSARLKGSIGAKGTHPITEYGLVWSTAANPTTSVTTKYSVKSNVTTFPAAFNTTASNLTPNTTYNFRAYVISNGVTTYGENKTFKTSEQVAPGIRTDDGPKIGDNVATVWGTLTARGSHPISEYGICWNTSANPTTGNSKKTYSGDVTVFPKQFDALMENLNPATTYHYRAYVIMNGTTTYGDNKSFVSSVSEPRVTTGDVFSISGRGTVMTGSVNAQGSFPITEIGIVYGPNNNPTTSNTRLSKSGSGVTYPHNYEFLVQGGFSGTGAVYFRAYVISNGTTYYGASKVARALPPGLSTGTNSLSGSAYTLRGSVNSAGTHPIREYGIVWSSTSNTPTTSHNKLAVTGSPSIPINFTRTLAISTIGSCRGVTYRAYAITTDGTIYYAPTSASFSTGGCVN